MEGICTEEVYVHVGWISRYMFRHPSIRLTLHPSIPPSNSSSLHPTLHPNPTNCFLVNVSRWPLFPCTPSRSMFTLHPSSTRTDKTQTPMWTRTTFYRHEKTRNHPRSTAQIRITKTKTRTRIAIALRIWQKQIQLLWRGENIQV